MVIRKPKRKPLAERLKAGLTEAVKSAKGDLAPRAVRIGERPHVLRRKK
jgi:hypothetical protein